MHRAPLRSTLAALVVALASPLALDAARADSWTLRATEDFPVIDAGEVPYYRDAERNALAINAAVVAYRDRFARASAPHPGPGGTFDIVLTTLAEVDGETTYHLLVDGNRVATATNPRVPDEFAERRLAFDDVEIPEGAVLSVESAAVSNELVPENGEFAFARGRWTALGITTDAPDTPAPEMVELSVSLAGPDDEVSVGDRFGIDASIRNADATSVATAPALVVELPGQLEFVSGEDCSATNRTVRCTLAEIVSGTAVALSLELNAVGSGTATIAATVSADQADGMPENDRTELDIELLPEPAIEPEPAGEPESEPKVGADPVASSSGGGAVWALILLSAACALARHSVPRRADRPAR